MSYYIVVKLVSNISAMSFQCYMSQRIYLFISSYVCVDLSVNKVSVLFLLKQIPMIWGLNQRFECSAVSTETTEAVIVCGITYVEKDYARASTCLKIKCET